MTSQIALDRIQGYLRQLTPQERGRLLVEMERLQGCGQGLAGADDIVQALRTEIRGSGQAAEKVGTPARLFFEALQPVLVDWSPERANRGKSRAAARRDLEWINQFCCPPWRGSMRRNPSTCSYRRRPWRATRRCRVPGHAVKSLEHAEVGRRPAQARQLCALHEFAGDDRRPDQDDHCATDAEALAAFHGPA